MTDGYALFASHPEWGSRQDFENWIHSDVFRRVHGGAGSSKGLYLDHPELELFDVVL